jgi:hypothetical protein
MSLNLTCSVDFFEKRLPYCTYSRERAVDRAVDLCVEPRSERPVVATVLGRARVSPGDGGSATDSWSLGTRSGVAPEPAPAPSSSAAASSFGLSGAASSNAGVGGAPMDCCSRGIHTPCRRVVRWSVGC